MAWVTRLVSAALLLVLSCGGDTQRSQSPSRRSYSSQSSWIPPPRPGQVFLLTEFVSSKFTVFHKQWFSSVKPKPKPQLPWPPQPKPPLPWPRPPQPKPTLIWPPQPKPTLIWPPQPKPPLPRPLQPKPTLPRPPQPKPTLPRPPQPKPTLPRPPQPKPMLPRPPQPKPTLPRPPQPKPTLPRPPQPKPTLPRPPQPKPTFPKPKPTCSCGISNSAEFRGRVIGGREAEAMAYPWTSYLTSEGEFICGGTLITDRHVMTAAHCVRGFEARDLMVTVGDHDRTLLSDAASLTVRVDQVLRHPGYERATYDNDIAVLALCRPVITPSIRPACMPLPFANFTGESVVAVGWGKIDTLSPFSNTLQEVDLNVVSPSTCRQMPLEPFETLTLTNTMICAGIPEGGKDACQGDSGGPLMWFWRDQWYVVGIVSKGYGCALPGRYGIYARVNAFSAWIHYVTRGARRCNR